MNKLILLALFALSALTLSAQFRPTWTTTLPPAKSNSLNAVAFGKTHEQARYNAVSQLVRQINIQKSDGSLRHQILEAGETPDQTPALIAAAVRSSFFKTVDTFAEDTAVWALCELRTTNLRSFFDSLQKAAKTEGYSLLREARVRRNGGDIYGAALLYAKGLNMVTPVMHFSLACDSLGGEDLAVAFYNEYATLYDGLAIDGNHHEFPMVKGEPIPAKFNYKVTRESNPVINLPMRAWIISTKDQGRLSTTRQTDGDGTFTVQVEQAPDAESARLCASVNADKLKGISGTILTQMLNHKIDSLAQHPWAITLRRFDPDIWCYIDADRRDSLEVDSVLSTLVKERGFKLAKRQADADLILKLSYRDQTQEPFAAGDYKLVRYSAEILLTMQVAKTSEQLMTYPKDCELVQPHLKSPERMRKRALTELMKRVKEELPERLAKVEYDKRSVVYGAAK